MVGGSTLCSSNVAAVLHEVAGTIAAVGVLYASWHTRKTHRLASGINEAVNGATAGQPSIAQNVQAIRTTQEEG